MEKYRMNPKQVKLIDRIVISIVFIAIIVFFIIAGCGCANKTSVSPKMETVVKPEFQSPEQTAKQTAKSGGNTYMTNVSLAGGGAVAGLMFLMIGVLGWKYFQSNKALHAVTSAVESLGHSAKSTVRFEAVAIGAEKYLRSKVKKWYKPKNNKTM